jgi:hypothetical protein
LNRRGNVVPGSELRISHNPAIRSLVSLVGLLAQAILARPVERSSALIGLGLIATISAMAWIDF